MDGMADRARYFRTLTDEEEQALVLRCTRVEMKKGEVLFKKDEKSNSLYLVESGEFVVTDERPGRKVFLSSIRPGGLIGEMAFLDESPRSATVTVKEDAVIWRMTKEDFLRVLLEDPSLGARLLMAVGSLLVERLRRADAALTSLSLSPTRQLDENDLQKAVNTVRGI